MARSRDTRAKTVLGRSRFYAARAGIGTAPPRFPRCCRPRQLGPELWEGLRLARVYERPCSPIVAASLMFKPDGTLPTLDEARAAAQLYRPPVRLRVLL